MDIAAILIGLAMAILVAAYVAEPLIHAKRPSLNPETENRKSRLEAEYRVALEAIRDLDFDFQTGKIVEEDYRTLRERTAQHGAALLKELDQAVIKSSGRQVAQRVSNEIEAMVQARRKAGAARTCPACGRPVQPGHRFCGKCGASLEANT